MNEQANKALSDLITNAASGLNGAIEFSKQQIPDVIHQLLLWNSVSSILSQISCLILIVLLSLRAARVLARALEGGDYMRFIAAAHLLVGAVLIPLAIIAFFDCFDWLEILIAPKLYLLQYAAHLIKG